MSNNFRIYEKIAVTPKEAIKPIEAGRLKGFSDINPMYRIKRLTEVFGPCGVGWWYDVLRKECFNDPETKQTVAFVDINLYYIDPETGKESKPIFGTGGSSLVAKERNGFYLSDEAYKMALTDALSVCCKALGMCSDIYYSKDRTKYTAAPQEAPKEAAPQEAPKEAAPKQAPKEPDTKFRCADCGAELIPYLDKNGVPVSLRKHAQGSENRFGRVLCLDCIKKVSNAD